MNANVTIDIGFSVRKNKYRIYISFSLVGAINHASNSTGIGLKTNSDRS